MGLCLAFHEGPYKDSYNYFWSLVSNRDLIWMRFLFC